MEINKALWMMLSALLFLFVIVDLVTSYIAFSLGSIELNPLFSENQPFIELIFAKLLGALFLIVYMISMTSTSWASHRFKKIYYYFLYGITVFYVVMMAMNIKVILYLL